MGLEYLLEGVKFLFTGDGWKNIVMMIIGCVLIFLAIKKGLEPSLLFFQYWP